MNYNNNLLTRHSMYSWLFICTTACSTMQMHSVNEEKMALSPPLQVIPGTHISMGVYEVTWEQWQRTMGDENPVNRWVMLRLPSPLPNWPVEGVSLKQIVEYCNRLSIIQRLIPAYSVAVDEIVWNVDANGFRLPTVSEWELAAKAGNNFIYSGGNDVYMVALVQESSPQHIPNIHSGFGAHPNAVGNLVPNAYGFYDMSGNVQEMTWDGYNEEGFHAVPPYVYHPFNAEDVRICKGGSYMDPSSSAQITVFKPCEADGQSPTPTGFRVVRTLKSRLFGSHGYMP